MGFPTVTETDRKSNSRCQTIFISLSPTGDTPPGNEDMGFKQVPFLVSALDPAWDYSWRFQRHRGSAKCEVLRTSSCCCGCWPPWLRTPPANHLTHVSHASYVCTQDRGWPRQHPRRQAGVVTPFASRGSQGLETD